MTELVTVDAQYLAALQAEVAELRGLPDAMSVLNRIRSSHDLETILQETVAGIRAQMGVCRVAIFEFDPTSGCGDGTFVAEDRDEQVPSAIARQVHDHCFGSQFAENSAAGAFQVVSDIYAADLSQCHIEILSQLQVRANLVVPLCKEEVVWGLLCLHQCDRPRVWRSPEIEFLRQVSTTLDFALRQADQWQRHQEDTDLLSQVPAAIFTLDLEQRVTSWNTSCSTLFGVEAAVVMGQDIGFMYPQGREQPIHSELMRRLQRRDHYEIELQLQRRSGELFYALLTLSKRRDQKGKLIGTVGYLVNITQRKAAEEEVRLSQEFLNTVINSTSDPIFVKDIHHRHILVNDALCQLLNRTQGEILGKNERELFDAEEAEVFWRIDERIFATQESFVSEEKITDASGQIRFVSTQKSFFADTQGHPYIVGTLRDITDRYRAEQAIRQSEARLRQLFEKSRDATLLLDQRGIVDCNQSALESLGIGHKDDLLFMPMGFISPKMQSSGIPTPQEFEQITALARSEGSYRCEWQFQRRDGSIFWAELVLTAISFENQPMLHLVWRDITNRKTVELALAESEAKFRMMVEQASEIIYNITLNGQFTYLSPGMRNLLGYDPSELIGHMFAPLVHPEDLAYAQQCLQQILAEPTLEIDIEYRALHKEGYYKWMSSIPIVLANQQGEAIGFQGIIRDISDRKVAEQALSRSESRFRSIVENANDLIYEHDAEGVMMYLSPRVRGILGGEPEQYLGRHYSELIHPEDCPQFASFLSVVATTQEARAGLEIRARHMDGSWQWLVCNVNPVMDREGRLLSFQGIARDITAYKAFQEAIHESERKYRTLVDTSLDIIWSCDGAGAITFINPAVRRIYGYEPREMIGQPFRQFCAPGFAEQESVQLFQAMLTEQSSVQYETTHLRCDGTPVELLFNVIFIRDERQQVVSFTGTASDVTERKQAEAALRESEARFQRIVANVPGAIYRYVISLDGSYEFVYMSPRCQDIFEVSPELVVRDARVLTQMFTPEDWLAFQDSLAEASICLEPWAAEFRIITPSHENKWIRFSAHPDLRVDQDGVIFWDGMVTDVTERKADEVALKTSLAEARGLNAILANLADGLLVTDAKGQITQVNPSLVTLFNLEGVSVRHRPCAAVMPEELSEAIAQSLTDPEQIVAAEVPLAYGRVGQAVAKTIFRLSDTEVDPILGVAVLIRDVTSEREIDKMKTDFISTVSHELRTPLTSVLGFASIIQEKLHEDMFPIAQELEHKKLTRGLKKIDANVQIIVAEAERLTSLINDVLDIAKMEAGKIEWHMQPVHPQEVIERALAATSALFETTGLELVRAIDPQIPMITGDRDRLIQVIINLISNAIKFTAQGTITCRAVQNQENVIISIIDTGVGIAPADQPKVFEKFKQVGDTLTDKPKGTGLGLPICQQIIEHHGGRIWVESELGQGSTFSFSLPLAAPSHPETPDYFPPELNINSFVQQLKSHVSVTAPLHGVDLHKQILVVDDDPHIRELLRQELEAEGYIVREARDGMDAINQVRQQKPDLILLDVMMPQINGFDVAAVLKNNPQTTEIPIIILSIVQDKQRGYQLGIDRYLTKPIDKKALLRDIGNLLSQGTSSKKIMVVDKKASTVNMIANVLETQGFSVVEALDSQDCIEKALAVKPDLIVVDSRISQETDLVRTLRFEKGMQNIVFVIMGESSQQIQLL
ncbi:MAG: PAS domain S-box protein [Oscillatoriales cyanobacterium SM2_2_1]|nr:PAS domain S-box protein [Oscillatoriales cyanobacterium SM2_2_1]